MLILLLASGLANLYSQTGGDKVYEFLNLSPNAYVSALGGLNISTFSNDPSMALFNPALSGPLSSGTLSMNYVNYIAGINYGSLMYSHHTDSTGSFAAGINYLNYGRLTRADEAGNINGYFKASEYALNIIYSRQIDSSFSLGANIKPIISQLESYISLGIAMDIGAAWQSSDGLVNAGLSIRNMGLQLTSYTGRREKLPFEIMAGISAGLKHAPFRFSLTARHMEKYKMLYDASEQDGQSYSKTEEAAQNIMRHLIFGVEILPTENFYIAAGFNYKRRKELMFENKTSTVGLSLGAGIKTTSVDISISRARYHLAAASTNFSILLKPSVFNILK
ncbi:MAG: type IX secretion system protein PorQ [Bacteroidales bacterium]|nr:type IX secretion system protein PorQ [Bacteroidales bacterium]